MLPKLLSSVFDISLKARMLREWQRAHAARHPELSDRELLIMQIVSDFGPVTEKELAMIFGLSPSVINELIGRLADLDYVDKSARSETDNRVKPLSLTQTGLDILARAKSAMAQRFEYLLASLNEEEQKDLIPILEKINECASAKVRESIFNEY